MVVGGSGVVGGVIYVFPRATNNGNVPNDLQLFPWDDAGDRGQPPVLVEK